MSSARLKSLEPPIIMADWGGRHSRPVCSWGSGKTRRASGALGEALIIECEHIGIDRFEVVHELLVQLQRFFRLSFCPILRFAQVDFQIKEQHFVFAPEFHQLVITDAD